MRMHGYLKRDELFFRGIVIKIKSNVYPTFLRQGNVYLEAVNLFP